MILTSLADVSLNQLGEKRLARALTWLTSTDLTTLPLGRVEIAGDEIFANVMELTTLNQAEKNFEAHRMYHDIHCVITGEELIGIAPVEDCTPLGEFNEADDFGLYDGPSCVSWVHLRAGDICLTPPSDAHKPGCACRNPETIKKLVVKVLV